MLYACVLWCSNEYVVVISCFHFQIKLPRLAQGVFAAIGDVYLYKLSRRLSGPSTARLALLCQLTSWFTFYCCTRTLTNSMETVLTTVAMYYFPWPDVPRYVPNETLHFKFDLLGVSTCDSLLQQYFLSIRTVHYTSITSSRKVGFGDERKKIFTNNSVL